MRFLLLFLVPILVLFSPQGQAHGVGQSFEQNVGSVLVDIGFDQDFAVGKDSLLDFALMNEKGDAVPFSSVEISLESGSIVQWKRTLESPEFGKPITSLLPEKSGHWSFKAVFASENDLITEAVFPVYVSPRALPEAKVSASVLFTGIILLLVACILYFFRRRAI